MSTMDDKPYLRWVPKYKQLRAQGLELEGISLRQAKVTVFSSNVWEDIRIGKQHSTPTLKQKQERHHFRSRKIGRLRGRTGDDQKDGNEPSQPTEVKLTGIIGTHGSGYRTERNSLVHRTQHQAEGINPK